ncbi:cation:proton antiporter [Butyrivibrio sp. YAB3001]|uniref:cation:proton antiporter n=1 Tax=Butyrivibrio sp. YAB3001 TaxID=1520812 RepID=UPI0008F66FFC|nr:cation:proton antiporter [Butyrivibrio sp. YAB3001]SFD11538.1 Kef-type K+ transport system, membrane component KefB [Butyrivibrio sp. YAB3001]
MDTLSILRDLAIIVIAAKVMGIVARKLKAPQVAGEIIAGLIIGPTLLNLVVINDFLSGMAEVGVILLMFSAGLETDIDNLKKSGIKATILACAGVSIPLILGTILYMSFYGFAAPGSQEFTHALFIGTILTATSVSITVQVLKELGKISSEVGATIMSAAIIDDVIGIVVLTAVLGLKDPNSNTAIVCLKTILFFAVSIVVGIIILYIMKKAVARWPHTRRIPIIGMAIAFVFSYAADRYFGVADITGAYVAGIILSSLDDSEYIDRKMDINSYMIFGPVFFASVGLQTNLKEIDMTILFFSLAFVVVGLLGKVIGCGLVAKILGYNLSDSAKIGVGMMTRGEVALIVAQRGLKAEIIDSRYFTAVILLIVISSILTPIILKAFYTYDDKHSV